MDGIMKFYLPFFYRLEKHIGDDQNVFFYNAAIDKPHFCGGRYPETIMDHHLLSEEILEISDRYGPRFNLLINSCFPELKPEDLQFLQHLSKNKSGIVVSKMDFAERLKQEVPDAMLHASCITFFYSDFDSIVNSDLFVSICAPQFWNFDLAKMVAMIPTEQRKRIYYIINSECKWTGRCQYHYEDMSLRYTGGKSENFTPDVTLPFGEPDDIKLAYRASVIGKKLLASGFDFLKIQGREKRPLDLLLIKSLIEGDRNVTIVDALLNNTELTSSWDREFSLIFGG